MSKRWSAWFRGVLLAAALTVALAACGGDDPTPTSVPAKATATPVPPPTATLAPGVPTPTPAPPTATPKPTPTPAFDAAAYFKGKTIIINVGHGAGGGYDGTARLFGMHAAKNFPGNPRIAVRNLGEMRSALTVYGAKPDGLTVGVFDRALLYQYLYGESIEGFNPFDIRWIGHAHKEATVAPIYCARPSCDSVEGLLGGDKLLAGLSDPGGSTYGSLIEMLAEFNYPITPLFGFGGSAERVMAFNRGETQIASVNEVLNGLDLFPEWVDEQYIVPVAQFGERPVSPDMPMYEELIAQWGVTADDIPYIYDVAGNLPEAAIKAHQLFLKLDLARALYTTPGVPDEVMAVWRDVWEQTVNDDEFIQGAMNLGRGYGLLSAAEIKGAVQEAQGLLNPETEKYFRGFTEGFE